MLAGSEKVPWCIFGARWAPFLGGSKNHCSCLDFLLRGDILRARQHFASRESLEEGD